jgi:hypothetical protein
VGLLSLLLGLPFAPVRGVIKLGELVQRQVEEELRHPASIRQDLEEIQRRREAGELSAEEEATAQKEVLSRVIEQPGTKER